MAEIDKALLGFLTGLARRKYCGEEQFTDQFLREEVLGNMKEDGKYTSLSMVGHVITFASL